MAGQRGGYSRNSTLLLGATWLRKGLHWAALQPGAVTTGWTELAPVALTPIPSPSSYTLTAASGTVTVDGTAAALARSVVPLAADAGAVLVDGQAATLSYGLRVLADAGAVLVAGTAATLTRTRNLEVAPGDVQVTGTDANMGVSWTLFADAGAVDVAGQPATLLHGREVAAEPGEVVINPGVASLQYGYAVQAASGTVTVAGTAVTFARHYVAAAAPGSVVVVGQPASLEVPNRLEPWPGELTVAGQDVSLLTGRLPLEAEPGAVTVSGQPVTFGAGRGVAAEPGAVVVAGQPVLFPRSYVLDPGPGAVVVTGTAATLLRDAPTFPADPGSVVVVGTPAMLRRDAMLPAAAGSVEVDGTPATLLAGPSLSVSPGAVVVNGTNATLTVNGIVPLMDSSISLPNSAQPATGAAEVKIYGKDAGGTIELFARASDGTESQLTPVASGGITTLTGDVTAGPGSGSQAATVVALQGTAVAAVPPANGEVLAYNGGTSQWEPTAAAPALPSIAKAAVRVATAAALPASTFSAGVLTADTGGLLNSTGIDGVTTLALGDRVLVKDEVGAEANLIYTITDLGSTGTGPQVPSVPAPATYPGALLTCGSGGTYATLSAAVAAAATGDRIQILPGTITEVATVNINKPLEVFGTGATCIVSRSSTTAVITVSATDAYLHDFAIVNGQQANLDPGGQSACVNADTMNRSLYGGSTGLYFANLACTMPKVGIFVSGTDWVVSGCTFAPNALSTTAGTTLRAVFAYGSEGTSYIAGNTVTTSADNARMTAIYLNTRVDGIAPNWEGGYKGSLVIRNNSIVSGGGAPRSYIDATSIYHQSGPQATLPPTGEFDLYIANNNFSLNHQSSPCVFFGRTSVTPLSFFNNFVVTDNSFGARDASLSQKGAVFWTNTSGAAVGMGQFVGGFYGANNTIASMTLPATNTSIMLDGTLLMVRENAYYNAPSPLLTLVPTTPPTPWEMTWADDFDADPEVTRGVFASVNEGTANVGTSWIVLTPDPISVGVTGLNWGPLGQGYAPATPADWSAPAPDDVQAALDRLAAAVAGLLGGPIP